MKYYHYIALGLGIVVFIGSRLSRAFSWYTDYWYADIILHVLSGVMFGFMWLWLVRKSTFPHKWLLYTSAIMAAVFGSFVWELWELEGWRIRPDHARYYIPSLVDSLSDIACGFFGAIVVSVIDFWRREK